MAKGKILNRIRERRKRRARFRIKGTAAKPRLSVFRSNRQTYAQLIDDQNQATLVSASTREVKKTEMRSAAEKKNIKIAAANFLGASIAKKAILKGIKSAVFDRRDKKYHGRVRAVAEGAREGGLRI